MIHDVNCLKERFNRVLGGFNGGLEKKIRESLEERECKTVIERE